jgi:hypothetical protein
MRTPQAMPWLSDGSSSPPGLPIYTRPAIEPVAVLRRWRRTRGPAGGQGQAALHRRSTAQRTSAAQRRQAGDPSSREAAVPTAAAATTQVVRKHHGTRSRCG